MIPAHERDIAVSVFNITCVTTSFLHVVFPMMLKKHTTVPFDGSSP
jgi:hypothetical protein